jgi:hypothetical protein
MLAAAHPPPRREDLRVAGTADYRAAAEHHRRRRRGAGPMAAINGERGWNPQGFLFNSERGVVFTPKLVTNIYDEATKDADEKLSFKQLRKIGYNRIKTHTDWMVAELWEGHAAGVTDSYDDGIFAPVIAAQKAWAEELRVAGLL